MKKKVGLRPAGRSVLVEPGKDGNEVRGSVAVSRNAARPGGIALPLMGGSDVQSPNAFTRLELLALVAVLALLAAVALPVLANSHGLSGRIACVSNLRQLGQAYHLWGNDHGEGMPIRTSYCEGGLYLRVSGCPSASPPWAAYINNAWFHYAWLSNEIVTPRILACPSDASAKPARNFSGSLNGGFANPVYRDNAVSYAVALDVFPGPPLLFIGADRNIAVGGYYAGCSSGVTTASGIRPNTLYNRWWPGLHGPSGNLLLNDGRVLQTSDTTLRRYLDDTILAQGDNGSYHILLPRP